MLIVPLMKVIYTGMGDIGFVIGKKRYLFNASNSYTIDVEDFDDIYEMIRDNRYGKDIKLWGDQKAKVIKRYMKPGILTMSDRQNLSGGSTSTISVNNKVQEVVETDKIVDDILSREDDVEQVIQEAKKKVSSNKGKKK